MKAPSIDSIQAAVIEAEGYKCGQQDYDLKTHSKNPFPNTPEGDIWERGYRKGKRHAMKGITG